MDQVVNKWIIEIKNFILKLDIDENLKIQTFNMLDNQYALIKDGMITNEIFGTFNSKEKTEEKFCNECTSFIGYLDDLLGSKGKKYFKTAINYSLNNSSEMSFIDTFIRFIIITNFNVIKINTNFDVDSMLEKNNVNDYDAGRGYIRAYLGGFLLCDLSQFSIHQYEDGSKYLDFYNLHARKNLKRTKIGTILIKALLDKMINSEKLYDYSLGSVWVMKNNAGARKFYEKLECKN